MNKNPEPNRKPKKRKTLKQAWQEGRNNLINLLIEHRRAVERMALDQKIEPEDRKAIIACAAFAYYELLRTAKERDKRRKKD